MRKIALGLLAAGFLSACQSNNIKDDPWQTLNLEIPQAVAKDNPCNDGHLIKRTWKVVGESALEEVTCRPPR